MQKWGLKILLGFVTILALSASHAQVFDYRLKMADSLYLKKQYTQSLELYREIFKQHAYTPAMLLKMAYIEEGLGQSALALYYVNLYYEVTRSEKALAKMEEMASKYNLSGYESTRRDHYFGMLNDFRQPITAALAGLIMLFLALTYYSVVKKGVRPYASLTFLLLFVAVMVVFINVPLTTRNGITQSGPAYLMSDPSSGSDVIGIISGGHRLAIQGKSDVWVKVKWNDSYAYVRENQVLEVKL